MEMMLRSDRDQDLIYERQFVICFDIRLAKLSTKTMKLLRTKMTLREHRPRQKILNLQTTRARRFTAPRYFLQDIEVKHSILVRLRLDNLSGLRNHPAPT